MPIHVLARAVIIKDHHLLVAYDPQDVPCHYYELGTSFYYLPGGHIDFQETAKDAVIRELKEETGYSAHLERFLGIVEHTWQFKGDDICCHTHEYNLIFKADLPLEPPTLPPLLEAHVAFKWIPLHQISEVDLRPAALKKLIHEWLNTPMDSAFYGAAL